MPRLCVPLLLCVFVLGLLCFAEAEGNQAEPREKRGVPNWALTSSDFFGWVEELRSHAGYDKIEELAKTFWAHFPSASRLGYDPPAPEE
ncbi:otospiralin-like [Colossoma macropomum]|uniref:otospiralin-like n=1 Tax=Colossoma macropomum TaxID=42526 RepID=UPI001863E203|nr:otospiralin-like [Colossoma macropomum]XP_036425376.1 otospiralin-like [Colossoma macropomum]